MQESFNSAFSSFSLCLLRVSVSLWLVFFSSVFNLCYLCNLWINSSAFLSAATVVR
jgi:hypothetical protein